MEDLNPQSIQLLLEMGYEFDIVVRALRALKEQKRYTPIGEVQKAIDWINEFSIKESEQ